VKSCRVRKICSSCQDVKGVEEFYDHPKGLLGKQPVCKLCQKGYQIGRRRDMPVEVRLWTYAKNRAKTKGLPFDITPEDIIVPEVCPVFGTKLDDPSLDRHIPILGYVKGNVYVMSNRANRLKSNGTFEEFEQVVQYLGGMKFYRDKVSSAIQSLAKP